MNKTEHYDLNQWELHDRVMMQDFNSDNAKIDTALAEHAETLGEHTATLATLGNCQIWTTTYVGNGEHGLNNPNSLTFPRKPTLAFVTGNSSYMIRIFPRDTEYTLNGSILSIKWEGNTVKWYSSLAQQLNNKNTTYYVIAFFAMDE